MCEHNVKENACDGGSNRRGTYKEIFVNEKYKEMVLHEKVYLIKWKSIGNETR